MKRRIIIAASLMLMAVPILAQNNASKIISLTPALPTNQDLLLRFKDAHASESIVGTPEDPINIYLDKYSEAEDVVRELPTSSMPDVSSAKEMSSGSAKASAMGALSGMGLSAGDVAKLQSGELSEAEQMAMVNKMMKAQGGPTSDDLAQFARMAEANNAGVTGTPEEAAEAAKKLAGINARPSSSQGKRAAILKMNEMERAILDGLKRGEEKMDEARAKGLDLYEKKYRSQAKAIQEGMYQARMDGAFEELPRPEDAARCKAAADRYNELNRKWDKLIYDFYKEYIVIWRAAIVGTMDYYKTDLMKKAEEKEAFRQQMYAQTGSTDFIYPSYSPEVIARQYFDFSKNILEFELELPDDSK